MSKYLLVLFGLAQTVPAAAELRVGLSARVEPSCQIINRALEREDENVRLNLQTVCNTQYFRFRLSTPNEELSFVSAASNEATITESGSSNELAVRLLRPGVQQFEILLSNYEPEEQQLNIEIVTF